MDILSIVGVIFAFAAIIGGNLLEGGHVQGLVNGPAAVIVIGGTFSAIFIQTSFSLLVFSLKRLKWIFVPPYVSLETGIDKVLSWSLRARKNGLLGLEPVAEKEQEPFAQKALQLLVDGTEPESIRSILEVEIVAREHRELDAARFYESMGGYSPTIGIIGAVMGLIHVMSNLQDPKLLGSGIATAFVATIYGVAFANLFLFPIASKLKEISRRQAVYGELMIEGIVSIAEGENPRAIEHKLKGFIPV
ncbi:MAG: flagellar motor protein [Gammaproteobacteria bacterium]|nr:MAG: flagellar motor protein [Pseudomonadota bacterium]PIE38085.1 MAG: flagellar motor protein [Gammaproteobacteria bacterium]